MLDTNTIDNCPINQPESDIVAGPKIEIQFNIDMRTCSWFATINYGKESTTKGLAMQTTSNHDSYIDCLHTVCTKIKLLKF